MVRFSSSIDRLPIYTALGVREVWRYQQGVLDIRVLGSEGSLEKSTVSRNFPFLERNVSPDDRGLPIDPISTSGRLRVTQPWISAIIDQLGDADRLRSRSKPVRDQSPRNPQPSIRGALR